MTLHGHTRIELTDVHTGAVEVVESDNLITNAVSDIFNGYGGSLNKAMLLWRGDQGYTNAPKDLVTMFYGGLLLYDTPLGSDPATVFAPAGAGVVGTAMAGQVNATKNTVRGSANLTETKIDPWNGVVTYVYEFATSQANGVIGSVCLTHPMGAYYSEMVDAPDAAACNADRLGFGGALGGDQLLTGILAKTTYPTDEKGVLLYADPEADEAVAGYLNADEGVLELRHHALGLKTLDLFRRDPTGLWDSLQSTDTLDVADFLQVDSSAGEDYCRICFDAEADKIYLVSAPEVDYVDAQGVVKVREYDRKTLAAKDYTVPNNTGVDLSNITVADTLDSRLRYSGNTGGYSTGTGAWTVASLANGKSVTLTLTVKLKYALAAGSVIENTASVTEATAAGLVYDLSGQKLNDSVSVTVTSGKGSPRTGDDSNLGLWIAVMAASLACAGAAAGIYKKRRG